MKTKEGLNTLKEEVETMKNFLSHLNFSRTQTIEKQRYFVYNHVVSGAALFEKVRKIQKRFKNQ